VPARTPDDVRDAILADIRAGQKSARRIAKDHQVAPSTVTKLAAEAHIPAAFERSNTKTRAATEARRFDAKAARAEMIEQLYGDAQRLRARAWEPYTVVVGSGDSMALVTLKQPPLRDQQAAYTGLAICLDKALVLEAKDDDQGAGAGKTMINDLFEAFQLAYHQQITEEREVDLTAATEEGTA
jgi:transposase-like protein